MLTYRTGAAGAVVSAASMASHLLEQTLPPEHAALAQYYQRGLSPNAAETDTPALSDLERAAAQIVRGEIDPAFVLDQLADRAMALASVNDAGSDGSKNSIAGAAQHGSVSAPPPLSENIGAVASHTTAAAAGMSADATADGNPLAGHDGREALRVRLRTEIGAQLESAITNAREAMFDGTIPEPRRNMNPQLAELLGLDSNRPPTPTEIAELLAGNRADGIDIPSAGHSQRYENRAKVSYIDLCWSADKSVSLAWAFAPTHAERNIIMQAHKDAVESAMAYVETEIGRARRGAAGSKGFEQGSIGWIAFDHYAARPTVEIGRVDTNGAAYTELVTLKVAGDPQLHTHVAVPNAVLTPSGHLGSLDLLGMEGRVHEFGAYYQAHLATNLRRNGIDAVLDERTGAARLPSVPDEVRAAYSKRTRDAEGSAREYAATRGIMWDELDGDRKAGLLKTAAFQTRRSKETGSPGDDTGDFVAWKQQADALGWNHASVIRSEKRPAEQSRDERLEIAYQASLAFVERQLERRAVLDESDVRLAAARGLVASGVCRPEDITAVTRAMRERGVRQDGEQTTLAWGEDASTAKGRPRLRITTALHERQEQEFIDTVQRLDGNREHSLTDAELTDAVERINVNRTQRGAPALDFGTDHGGRQFGLARSLGIGGDYALGIGVAGSGKTAVIEPLVEAYRHKGYEVIGTALAWRQTDDLEAAGISRRFAMAKLLDMDRRGSLDLTSRTVIFVDEYGLIGTRNGLALAQIGEKYGCKIINVGDQKQCQSIEAGPLIDLARRALGTRAVPELLSSIRQETERERQTALMFREGDTDAAIAIKREDGTARIVAGGQRPIAEYVAALWEDRHRANAHDADFRLTISAPTNEDARILASAIRDRKQALGQVGPTLTTIAATDQSGAEFDLALAVGDHVRLFDRVTVKDEAGVPHHIGNNGSVVEVRGLDRNGVVLRSERGAEGYIPWSKLRDHANERTRLTYGDVLSIDATQGVTSTEHINALPSGSRAITGFKAYVAESRHRRATWLVVSDGAERREIMGRRPIGDVRAITADDVWENVARNLGRQPEKPSALMFLDRAHNLRRTAVHALQETLQPAEQRAANGRGGTALPERFAHARSDQAAHRMARRVGQSDRDRKAAVDRLKQFGPAIIDAMSKGLRRAQPAWESVTRRVFDRSDRDGHSRHDR